MQESTNRGIRELNSDLSGGINQFQDPTKIAGNEFTEYQNLIGYFPGRFLNATKRKGFEPYNTAETNSNVEIQSITKYINPISSVKAIDRLIVKSASTIEYLDGTTFTDIATGLDSGKVDFETANTNLYIAGLLASGSKIPNKFYDGTNYLDVGCPPPNSPAITATGNSMGSVFEANQEYHWVITFLYDGKQESSTISVESQQAGVSGHASFTLTNIPTGNARVTARKIYRGKKNDTSSFYLVGVLNNNSGTTFTDSTPDANLGTPIPASVFYAKNKPYISKNHVSHNERLVQGNINDNYYNAIPAGDITLTGQAGGGSLTGTATYKYRFLKMWRVALDTGRYVIAFSQFMEKSITLTGLQNQVQISYSGSDDWFKTIAILRTSANGNDFLFVPNSVSSQIDFPVGSFPYVDGLADNGRYYIAGLEPLIPSDSRTEFPNGMVWTPAGNPDLYPPENFLEIGGTDQQITGLFSEENRIVVFKDRSIYEVQTEVSNSAYWKQKKIVEHIGAPYKDAIVRLPSGGYVFYSGTAIYLWDGYGIPQKISEPVHMEVSAITSCHLAYDKVRNWVRCVYNVSGTAGRELNFDLNNGKWYPFKENTTALKLGCPFQLEDGTMIYGGTNNGRLMKYGTANQDNLNTTGSTFANVGILVKLQTRTYDTWITVKEFLAKIWASGNGTMNLYYGVDATEGTPIAAPITGEITRIRRNVNMNAKEFYVRMENAENIALSFKQIGIHYEPKHTESDGF